MQDPSFLDIEVSTFMSILDQDKLNIDSELDLFNALLRYATERGMFGDEASQNSTQPNPNAGTVADGINIEEIKMEPDVNAMMQGREENFNSDNDSREDNRSGSPDVLVVDSDSLSPEGTDIDKCPTTQNERPSTSANNVHYFMDAQRLILDEVMLREAVKKIRFLTMTPQQFAEGPARSKLLQQHEALAILIKISSPTINDQAMPEGFCGSRCSRNYYEQRSNQRDLSSYRLSQPAGSNMLCSFLPIDAAMPQSIGGYSGYNQASNISVVSGVSMASAVNDTDVATNDTRRCYCVRTVNPQYDYRNTSVTDCGLTFQVDTNIWITGKYNC